MDKSYSNILLCNNILWDNINKGNYIMSCKQLKPNENEKFIDLLPNKKTCFGILKQSSQLLIKFPKQAMNTKLLFYKILFSLKFKIQSHFKISAFGGVTNGLHIGFIKNIICTDEYQKTVFNQMVARK